jgi:hypothetical protein
MRLALRAANLARVSSNERSSLLFFEVFFALLVFFDFLDGPFEGPGAGAGASSLVEGSCPSLESESSTISLDLIFLVLLGAARGSIPLRF